MQSAGGPPWTAGHSARRESHARMQGRGVRGAGPQGPPLGGFKGGRSPPFNRSSKTDIKKQENRYQPLNP